MSRLSRPSAARGSLPLTVVGSESHWASAQTITGRLLVNLPELKLNFVALVNAAMHQLSNGGDQHRLQGWKHLLPNSEEEFMDVLEMTNIQHAKDELFEDEKPAAQPDDEADAEDFETWEDDDVAEEEQADEVAEEPVFCP